MPAVCSTVRILVFEAMHTNSWVPHIPLISRLAEVCLFSSLNIINASPFGYYLGIGPVEVLGDR